MLRNKIAMKDKLMLLLIIISLSTGICAIIKSNGSSGGKIGYVDIKEVFEKFEMKKELQITMEKSLQLKQIHLDSLQFKLRTLGSFLQKKNKVEEQEIIEFQQLEKYIIEEKEKFDIYQQEQTQKYNAQIIDQMTQYIADFGYNYQYDYILGSNDNGNVLYGKKTNNITEKVTKYINELYNGN